MNAHARLSASVNERNTPSLTSQHWRNARPSPRHARIVPRTMQFTGAHTISRNVSKLKQSTVYYLGGILTLVANCPNIYRFLHLRLHDSYCFVFNYEIKKRLPGHFISVFNTPHSELKTSVADRYKRFIPRHMQHSSGAGTRKEDLCHRFQSN